jgi:D-glycero-beta-D-manno-heptose 1-phosphate adenylyltransferase
MTPREPRPAPSAHSKIVPLADAVARVAAWRAAGERVVLANGVFDLVHVGHARYLAGARAQGMRLVVGVNGDRSAAALKGAGRPVLGEHDRALLVAALRCVDLVVVFAEASADALLVALAPDVHAKGTDYRPDTVPERATMAALGGRTVVTGDAKQHASRELFERVRARHAAS